MIVARPIAVAGLVLALAGCEFTDKLLVPPASVEATAGASVGGEPATAKPAVAGGELGAAQTAIADQKARFQALRGQSADHTATYQATVRHVAGRLRDGAPAGDPKLTDEWRIAEEQLGRMQADLVAMRSLAGEIAGSAAAARGLQEDVSAQHKTATATERDSLRLLDENTTRVAFEADRLLADANLDAERQDGALAMERNNLSALSLAVRSGQPVAPASGGTGAAAAPPGAGVASGRPFIVIRFDRPDVDFAPTLQDAVTQAMERRPTVAFDVVAVGMTGDAASAEEARARMQDVVRVLEEAGVTRDRIAVSSATSRKAKSGEVHLYLR